jgi:hypothetical protein
LLVCWSWAPSMTRGRVCHLQFLLAISSAVIFGSESRRTRGHILLSQIETSLFIASYDSQGHGGGIRPRLHTGMSPIYSLLPYLFKVHFDIILVPSSRSSRRTHSLMFSFQNFVLVRLLFLVCYMTRPPHLPWFDHHYNNLCRKHNYVSFSLHCFLQYSVPSFLLRSRTDNFIQFLGKLGDNKKQLLAP